MSSLPEWYPEKRVYRETSTSTNDDVFDLLLTEPSGLVWTLNQSEGRGTRGRLWCSPAGHGLALSFGWNGRRVKPPDTILPLCCALLLRKTLAQVTGYEGFKVKWPNDLLLEQRKLGGILRELRITDVGVLEVIGIGLNLCHHPDLDQLDQPAASLDVCGPVDPERIVKTLVANLVETINTLSDPLTLQRQWMDAAWLKPGERFDYVMSGRQRSGTFRGIDERGYLLLTGSDGHEKAIKDVTADFKIMV